MESRVQTFDNSKYCLYFTIPPFLQFLNCNSQIDMILLQVCQYLKLKPASDHVKRNDLTWNWSQK